MQIFTDSAEDYISKLPDERKESFRKLLEIVNDNLPKGFEQNMQYGMVTWCVPLETYPDGYHCAKNAPLPFLSIASQKNFIALYHMGIYAKAELLNWFVTEFPKYSERKLDMGKSCIRFKKPGEIPMELIAGLCKKMTVEEWISIYEKNYKK